MIMGLGCACQEQEGTGIRGLGDCGDQPPAASVQYADWYNCWNAEQANPTPPITSWIAFNPQGQPVTVIPKTVSTPTVVVPYTAPLPTNTPQPAPVAQGTAIVNTSASPVVVSAPVVSVPVLPVSAPISTVSDPVIGITQTAPVADTTVTTDYTDYLLAGGAMLLGLWFLSGK